MKSNALHIDLHKSKSKGSKYSVKDLINLCMYKFKKNATLCYYNGIVFMYVICIHINIWPCKRYELQKVDVQMALVY